MRALIRLVLAFAVVFLCGPAFAGLQIEAASADSRILVRLDRLSDTEGSPSIEEILAPELQARFVPVHDGVRGDYSERPVWLRLRVTHAGPASDWLFATSTTRIRNLDVFGPFDADGTVHSLPIHTGIAAPYSSRPLSSERFVFRMRFPGPGEYAAYVRLVVPVSQAVDFSLWEPAEYLVARSGKRLFDGIAYGILLTLLMYNAVLALALRDRAYALYVLNCVFALLTLASFNGHLARYLFPNSPLLSEMSYLVWPSAWLLAGTLFAREFLDLGSRAPRMGRLLLSITVASLVGLVAGIAQRFSLAQQINELVSVLGVIAFTGVGSLVAWRGYSPARWYLLGQSALFLAVLSIVATNWGLVDWPFVLANGLQGGILVEMIVFSVALSARIRLIQAQTRDLQARAGRFAIAARTDPLTGVANRAGLEAWSGALLAAPGPHGLMLLDLDRFKPVNDRYGHLAGDQVLVEVARRLGSVVRDSDLVARLGGDEFVVLVSGGCDRASLEARGEAVRAAICAPIPFDGGEAVLDCSVGIALHPDDGVSVEALIERADHAMYQAKRAKQAGERVGSPATESRA